MSDYQFTDPMGNEHHMYTENYHIDGEYKVPVVDLKCTCKEPNTQIPGIGEHRFVYFAMRHEFDYDGSKSLTELREWSRSVAV